MIGLAGTMGVSMLGSVAGYLSDSYGPTIPIILGSLFLFCGYATTHYCYTHTIANFYILALGGMCAGFGSTLAYSAVIKTAALNFPHHRGTAVAFPLAAFGLSALFFSTIRSLYYDKDTAGFLALLAIVTSLLCLFNAPLAKPPPPPLLNFRQDSEAISSECSSFYDVREGYGAVDNSHIFASSSRHSSQSTLAHPIFARESLNSHRKASVNSYTTDISVVTAVEEQENEEGQVGTLEMVFTVEFWAQTIILGFISGIAQMYIYCCGYIVRALVIANSSVDPVEVAQLQSLQVAIISLFSFIGRLLGGVVSDVFTKSVGIQRLWIIFIATVVATASHFCMFTTVTDIRNLWIVSSFIGLSYGLTFGVFPTIVCDTFGIKHFSKNWGIVAMSPVFTVYIFNLLFGQIYDGNSFEYDGTFSIFSSLCIKGVGCYSQVFQITTLVSLMTAISILWMIYTRKHQAQTDINKKDTSEESVFFE